MFTVEIWEALDGNWHARLFDPILGPDLWELIERSRGGVIAAMQCQLPRRCLDFQDRFRPADG